MNTSRPRVFAAGVCVALSAHAAGAIVNLSLSNHPDANQDPPAYGLRLDNLFLQTPESGSVRNGGAGGVTTFSFDPAIGGNVNLAVTMVGASLNIQIAGTVFGGVDAGSTYGFGAALYSIDFTYSMNVFEVTGANGGYGVNPNSVFNTGTITALSDSSGSGGSSPDITAGTSWRFYDQAVANGNPFRLLQDGHRLGAFPAIAAMDPFVGRGWVTYNSDGTDTPGTQDWIFLGVPAPSSAAAMLIGALAIGRRRRAN